MLINDVCKECTLTKKAIEYYVEQGLISPRILENGYRDFSTNDIEELKKINILRKLDVSIEDIRAILNDPEQHMLNEVAHRKILELEQSKRKQHLLEQLIQADSWDDVSKQIQAIKKSQTITQKLLEVFPGYYGRFISLHFARFLDEPIQTPEQQDAYNTIVAFLDDIPSFPIPPDLKEYLEEATKSIGADSIREMFAGMQSAVQDTKQYIDDHRRILEEYMAYKKTDEYKNSPAYRLQNFMRKFNSTSGYHDVFIPAMKRLSSKYNHYCTMVESANEKLIEEYPEIMQMNDPDDNKRT